MKKQSLLTMILASFVIVLVACSPATAEATPAPQAQAPDTLISEGRLIPIAAMDQSFSLPGQVGEILVRDGQAVTAGQVLARLDDSAEAQLALARAQQELLAAQQAMDSLETPARLHLAEARLSLLQAQEQLDAAQEKLDDDDSDLNRAALDVAVEQLSQAKDHLKMLESGDGVNPDQRAAAEARLTSAEAAVQAAESALAARELQATMDGTIVDADLKIGQRVTPGQPVLTLADFSSWVVETDNLTEMEVTRVTVGQPVEIIFDALPDGLFTGQVTHINARFEEKRGEITYTVTLSLTQSDPRLMWGMTAAVYFLP